MNDKVNDFSFNLWNEPWIDLETLEGKVERRGIGAALTDAHTYRGIFSHSPLEVVGIHRLLTAILQDALMPKEMNDLSKLWLAGKFDANILEGFASSYLDRFDLFSENQPFLQSGDLPLKPFKGDSVKTPAYLFPEIPAGTNVVHFQHNMEADQVFCPACCSKGLVVIPAFATTGGAGIKPSINGVPPIYILPGGKSLFESLLASLMLPEFQPVVRDVQQDLAWWKHSPVVEKNHEILSVGYVHSLTFPARRVRLHPQKKQITCSRCGQMSPIGVSSMVFEMGEYRTKEASFWQDPFSAYTLRIEDAPLPVRPRPGKALWREYGSLFLKMPLERNFRNGRRPIRPQVVDQFAVLQDYGVIPVSETLPFRCIGLRTDMKAKLFEWIDSGFDVSLNLLQSSAAGPDVDDAIEFTDFCIREIAKIFNKHVNEGKDKGVRYANIKSAMVDSAWSDQALPFREYLLDLNKLYQTESDDGIELRKQTLQGWYHQVVVRTLSSLENALSQTGGSGRSLQIRYETLNEARKVLYGNLKKKEEGLNE